MMNNVLQTKNRQQVIEHCLYVLQKMQRPNVKKMTLLLYLAERYHLLNWGLPLLTTKFTAGDDGPCLPETENDKQLVFPTRKADTKWLSRAAQESIEHTVIEYDGFDYHTLCTECKRNAWAKARFLGNLFIDKTLMAEEAGTEHDLVEYIRELLEIDDYFNS